MIYIVLTFVILATLSLWFIIDSRALWWVKAVVIAISLYFSICLYMSLDDLKGYPTNNPLPDQFEIHWAVVKQPSKTTDFPGVILVWVTSLKRVDILWGSPWLDLIETCKLPKVYALPYSKNDHRGMNAVLGKIREGQRVIGERGRGKNGEGKGKGPPGEGKGQKGGQGWSFSIDGDLKFYKLPPPIIPNKIMGE
jgi:hypothetical protein